MKGFITNGEYCLVKASFKKQECFGTASEFTPQGYQCAQYHHCANTTCSKVGFELATDSDSIQF